MVADQTIAELIEEGNSNKQIELILNVTVDRVAYVREQLEKEAQSFIVYPEYRGRWGF